MFTVFPSSTSNFTSNFTSNLARLLLSAILLASTAGLAIAAEAVNHNSSRSNRGTVVGGSEAFALACELHCESGGWRIEVSESLASNDAVLGFQPQDTIYTLGADLYQPGDHYITHATAADGYFVNYPGEAPTAIVGPVYERYGPSPQPSSVYTPPIDDGGISFCDPDPATGAAPLTSLLDILEIEGIADTETLPLSCEDHTGIEAYAKNPNAGTPGETRSAIELMIVVAIIDPMMGGGDTTESLTLLPERVELDPATVSADMTPRLLDSGPDLFELSNGGHPTTKEACEAAGGVWKCDPAMPSCFCFLPIKTGRSLSGGYGGDDDAQLTNPDVTMRGGNNDPRYWTTRSGRGPNNDPIPGIDIIVEKDPEDHGASSSPPTSRRADSARPGQGPPSTAGTTRAPPVFRARSRTPAQTQAGPASGTCLSGRAHADGGERPVRGQALCSIEPCRSVCSLRMNSGPGKSPGLEGGGRTRGSTDREQEASARKDESLCREACSVFPGGSDGANAGVGGVGPKR